jgi:hypothetical protein
MRTRTCLTLAMLAAVLIASLPNEAEARVRVIFYHYGEGFFESGPLPAPFDKDKKLKGATAGYKCMVFGLFWAYFHTWKCSPGAYRGDQSFNDPKLVAAIDAEYKGAMEMGPWQRHGRWAFALLFLAFIVRYFIRKMRKPEEE